MLLCIDKGAVSAEDTDPRLRELIDDRRELWDGVAGSGFSSSFPNSLNSLSKPGCICRAIIGKWLSRSLKDLTSFFRGIDELAPPEELATADCTLATSLLFSRVAGMMGLASHVPIKGRDMK